MEERCLMAMWRLIQGTSPLIVNVPHAGTMVPDSVSQRLTRAARALPDTDWHVEKLYDFVADEGVTLMTATQSRYVVDLNRDPSGAELYAGADNTELCPTRTFADETIYQHGMGPTADEVTQRIVTHFLPYHQALAQEVARVKKMHGYAIVLDGHSIRGEVPRFFAGRLADLNLGTASGTSCMSEVEAAATSVLKDSPGFTHVVNGRFKGGWITRHYGRPYDHVHALQLEIAQRCYMDESPPYAWDPARAASLVAVLRRLVAALGQWRPAS
jgi:N-formylglutamate deformylase